MAALPNNTKHAQRPPAAPEIRIREYTMTSVTKAVFPVAGLGTRFLPATKALPKELLPIIDKPIIQYAVEEAIAAGICGKALAAHQTVCNAARDCFFKQMAQQRALTEAPVAVL